MKNETDEIVIRYRTGFGSKTRGKSSVKTIMGTAKSEQYTRECVADGKT